MQTNYSKPIMGKKTVRNYTSEGCKFRLGIIIIIIIKYVKYLRAEWIVNFFKKEI